MSIKTNISDFGLANLVLRAPGLTDENLVLVAQNKSYFILAAAEKKGKYLEVITPSEIDRRVSMGEIQTYVLDADAYRRIN